LHAGTHALWRAAAARARRRCLSAGEIKQVRPLGLVKPQRARASASSTVSETPDVSPRSSFV
jgi:hypothetical protein